ncbi:hypothetical protein CH63R_14636 [Colletotrichum higginsianum IMI 349063]|uniref:Uncharacterized protein n=1 Tax=Colletotrichum higginsianum (strain IMI 349063) TaxID=759273 RepID=A0A1B7XQR3_COLHI|nr:hypothetical protein CH63R_14636 [Colletotrichum higginsianum IMI 349063]OBR02064.1 hypothetical protein CH63R_14636 [Colletotrichum higginsianum IMI 349063]GJD05408.1 hypothetical protein ColKHC_14233 [Colletotrichum higginsianum]
MAEASASFTRHSRAFSASARNALGHQLSMGRDAAAMLAIETQLQQLGMEHNERHADTVHKQAEEDDGLVREENAVEEEEEEEGSGRCWIRDREGDAGNVDI